MPEEQQLKEDLVSAQKSRDDKPKGQPKFLQKYWHKGAFHPVRLLLGVYETSLMHHLGQDSSVTEANESTVDVSLLPAVMQVNFGKRSRTKYMHLVD